MKRSLRLRSESLAELSAEDLGSVAGGATTPTCACTRAGCFSLDECPVPTLPVRECPIWDKA